MFRTILGVTSVCCVMLCGFAAFAINLYLAVTALNAPLDERNIDGGIGLIEI